MKRIIKSSQASSDDIEFIVDAYGLVPQCEGVWERYKSDDELVRLHIYQGQPVINVIDLDNDFTLNQAVGVQDVLKALDAEFPDIFASVSIIDSIHRTYVQAAGNLREMSAKLVRVKSSNIWSYGIDIEDKKSKTGDVMVQFKGKQGGPTGGLYLYYDVPVNLWRMWLSATSKGHFFWVYIRNNFKYRKLDGDKRTHLPNGL